MKQLYNEDVLLFYLKTASILNLSKSSFQIYNPISMMVMELPYEILDYACGKYLRELVQILN